MDGLLGSGPLAGQAFLGFPHGAFQPREGLDRCLAQGLIAFRGLGQDSFDLRLGDAREAPLQFRGLQGRNGLLGQGLGLGDLLGGQGALGGLGQGLKERGVAFFGMGLSNGLLGHLGRARVGD